MSNEYYEYLNSAEWHRKSRFFQGVMQNRDCVFPFLKTQDAHHMTYRNLKHEVFLRDVVPLNKTFHLKILHPFMRLWHRKHDLPFLRFWVNWLLLRPSCAFWFVWLTAIALTAKIIGWKPVALTLGAISAIATLLALNPAKSKYALMYWAIAYVCLVGYSVINKVKK